MLDAELNREMKKTPVVEYEIPKHIFTRKSEEEGGPDQDSMLVKLWDFQ
jgi:U3 small nucleolar RNA-associated protein 19